MIILVTGPRDWRDFRTMARALDEAASRARSNDPITVIQGGARGADNQAKQIARINGWVCKTFESDWQGPCQPTCRPGHRRTYRDSDLTYCPAAGDYRNQAMADYQPKPNMCIAMIGHCWKTTCFPQDHMTHGTADMIRRAKKNGIPIVPFGEVELYVNLLYGKGVRRYR